MKKASPNKSVELKDSEVNICETVAGRCVLASDAQPPASYKMLFSCLHFFRHRQMDSLTQKSIHMTISDLKSADD